jgi:hypothetical protein
MVNLGNPVLCLVASQAIGPAGISLEVIRAEIFFSVENREMFVISN